MLGRSLEESFIAHAALDPVPHPRCNRIWAIRARLARSLFATAARYLNSQRDAVLASIPWLTLSNSKDITSYVASIKK